MTIRTTDEQAMQQARTNARLWKALEPHGDGEEWCLQMLAQVVQVHHIDTLADMAERITAERDAARAAVSQLQAALDGALRLNRVLAEEPSS